MKFLRQAPKFTATLSLAFYLFVALFSQNFHDHGSAEIFRDLHFKKTEKTISEAKTLVALQDCLSCHVLYEGHSLLPQEFGVRFFNPKLFEREIFSYRQRFSSVQIFTAQLRGPPSYTA